MSNRIWHLLCIHCHKIGYIDNINPIQVVGINEIR